MTSSGTVWMWNYIGGWSYYHTGLALKEVPGLINVVAIAGGTALRGDNTVWQFRVGKFMDIPTSWNPDTGTSYVLPPLQVPNVGNNVVAIASGVALDRNGYVWGWNPVIADRWDYVAQSRPVRLPSLNGTGYFNTGANPPTLGLFTDVSATDWFYPYVRDVFSHGIMVGTTETTFAPNTNFSRAMVVATLYRVVHGGTAREIPYPQNREVFSDVLLTQWYAPYVAWAYDNEIVMGVGGNRFAPDTNVTREEFSAMMYRFAEFMGYDVSV